MSRKTSVTVLASLSQANPKSHLQALYLQERRKIKAQLSRLKSETDARIALIWQILLNRNSNRINVDHTESAAEALETSQQGLWTTSGWKRPGCTDKTKKKRDLYRYRPPTDIDHTTPDHDSWRSLLDTRIQYHGRLDEQRLDWSLGEVLYWSCSFNSLHSPRRAFHKMLEVLWEFVSQGLKSVCCWSFRHLRLLSKFIRHFWDLKKYFYLSVTSPTADTVLPQCNVDQESRKSPQ